MMAETIHQPDMFFDVETFGKIYICICGDGDDDNPECPALIEFDRRRKNGMELPTA